MTKISEASGPELCKALPGFHAFTGCDYTAAFARKGKVKPLNILKKKNEYVMGFAKLGENDEPSTEVKKLLEKFTCEVYGYGQLDKINDVRYKIFVKQNKPSRAGLFENIKNSDPSLLPPCHKVVLNKIKRCNYICKLWNNTSNPNPLNSMKPEDHGWEMSRDMYIPKWNPENHLPTTLLEVEDSAYDEDSNENDHQPNETTIHNDDSDDDDDEDI